MSLLEGVALEVEYKLADDASERGLPPIGNKDTRFPAFSPCDLFERRDSRRVSHSTRPESAISVITDYN